MLAYIVDANAGRSSSAVAVNSLFRGLAAFVAAEVAIPLQVRIVVPLDVFVFFYDDFTPRVHQETVAYTLSLRVLCFSSAV